jgi:membrane-associated phospholipid phosphatase
LSLASPPALAKQDCDFNQAATRTGITAGGLGLYLASELSKGALAGDQPRWIDSDINGFDRLGEKMRWQADALDEGAASVSDQLLVVSGAAIPVLTLAGQSRGWCLVEDFMAIYEGVGAAMILNQSAKFIALRQRPFVRDLREEERSEICADPGECKDLNLSFYSGHATWTFSVASAAFAIAKQRGYDTATAAAVLGGMSATLTAYLRVAAGKHYLSDVATGAALGIAVGYLVPTYLHPVLKERAALLPTRNGFSLVGSF